MSFAARRCARVLSQRRTYATVADAGGVKVASSVETPSSTSAIAVVVKAGSRYESQPGLAHVLKHSLFKKTNKRSAIRLVRETEMLGGVLSSALSREHLVLTAEFLKGDEAYFAEVLGEAVTQAKFAAHEFNEEVVPAVASEYEQAIRDSTVYALDLAHSLAFRTGLGNSLYASPHTAVDYSSAVAYAKAAFSPSNIAVLGAGVEQSTLQKLVSQHFGSAAGSAGSLTTSSSSYYGGEVRVNSVNHAALDTLVLAFKGASSSSVELDVLRHILGGQSSLKWSAGASPLSQVANPTSGASAKAFNLAYSDAGLFGVVVQAPESELTKVATAVVEQLKKVAKGDGVDAEAVKRAIAKAKFTAAEANESRLGSIEVAGAQIANTGSVSSLEEIFAKLDKVTPESVTKAAAEALKSKPTVAVVGNPRTAPYADQLGF